MAFNPFSWFRKHQKALFAIVTIVIMFVFILQFGRGDAFERILGWTGAGRSRGPVVATLNGTKIREVDLDKVQRQRKMASDFMFDRIWNAHPRALQDLLAKELKSDSKNEALASLRGAAQRSQQRHQEMMQTAMFLTRVPPEFRSGMEARMMAQVGAPIQEDLRLLESLAGEFADDTDRMALLEKVTSLTGFQLWLAEHFRIVLFFMNGMLPDELYFGGGYKTVDDQLDFLLWKQQADKLGINLTDADLGKEINREAAGYEVFDSEVTEFSKQKSVLEFFNRRGREYGNLTHRDLLDALRDEFRALLAQGILVGIEPGVRQYRSIFSVSGSPAVVTPDEFLNFFRENRTELNVALLAVPAEKFLGDIRETPTEGELRRRYELFKEKEPLPSSRDPGFKEPRRIVAEYVTASAGDSSYRNEARKQAEVLHKTMDPRFRAWAAYGSGFFNPVGSGVLGPALLHVGPLMFDPVRATYQKHLLAIKEGESSFPPAEEQLSDIDYRARVDLARLAQPTRIATTVGILGGTGGSLRGLANLYAGMAHDEVFGSGPRHRLGGTLRQELTAVLALSSPQHVLGAVTLAGIGPAERGRRAGKQLVLLPEEMPARELRPMMQSALRERLARGMLKANLETIRTELQKRHSEPKRAEEYLARVVKEYHLKRQQMPRPMSQLAMIEALNHKVDLGIKDLLEAAKKQNVRMRDRDFASDLFGSQGAYEARLQEGGSDDQRQFLYWRKEDLPARVRPFKDVRELVVRAWKMERARQKAEEEAVRLEKAINDNHDSPVAARRYLAKALAEKKDRLGPLFELDHVSQLVPVPSPNPLQQEYRTYRVAEDMTTLFPYPPPDLVKQFLALVRPGDATVVADQPAQTFYVCVLVSRDEPSVRQFGSIYSRSPRTDSLYRTFLRERMEEYRRKVLEQLRRDAGKVDNQGRFEVPESLRKRDTSRLSDVEE